MTRYFVPFSHNIPSAIEIKGHRLLILSTSKNELSENSGFLGSDEIRELYLDKENDNAVLAQLAESAKGGIVVTPPGMTLESVIISLEQELPWVH